MGKQDRFTEEFKQEAVVQVVENGQGPLRGPIGRLPRTWRA